MSEPIVSALQDRARAYWEAVTDSYDLNVDGLELLVETCECIDRCDRLAAQLREEGLMVEGRYGPKAHPALSALRSDEALLAKLVAQLGLPDPEGGVIESPATLRARKAAETRWQASAETRKSRKAK